MCTLDLRHSFKNKLVSWQDPSEALSVLTQKGVTRIVLPWHWRTHPWEEKSVLAAWVREAHRRNVKALIYSGPFGTEPKWEVKKHPEWPAWLQRKSDGGVATFSGLSMFCPSSPYLMEYRLPIVMELINEIPFDGLFFDIPWLVDGACFCDNCRKVREGTKKSSLVFPEQIVRAACQKAVNQIRQTRLDFWLSINAAAPAVWNTRKTGATPQSLAGMFDELVVEWTPNSMREVQAVVSSIELSKKADPNCQISYAYKKPANGEMQHAIHNVLRNTSTSRWLTELNSVSSKIKPYKLEQ